MITTRKIFFGFLFPQISHFAYVCKAFGVLFFPFFFLLLGRERLRAISPLDIFFLSFFLLFVVMLVTSPSLDFFF